MSAYFRSIYKETDDEINGSAGTDDTVGATGDGAGGNAADGAVGDGTNDSSGTNTGSNTSTDGSASTDGSTGAAGDDSGGNDSATSGAAMRKKRDEPSNEISKLFHILLQIAMSNFHRSYLVYSRASVT